MESNIPRTRKYSIRLSSSHPLTPTRTAHRPFNSRAVRVAQPLLTYFSVVCTLRSYFTRARAIGPLSPSRLTQLPFRTYIHTCIRTCQYIYIYIYIYIRTVLARARGWRGATWRLNSRRPFWSMIHLFRTGRRVGGGAKPPPPPPRRRHTQNLLSHIGRNSLMCGGSSTHVAYIYILASKRG